MPYSDEQVEQFRDHLDEWIERERRLTTTLVIRPFRRPETNEIVRHGLMRRLAMLTHAAERTFEVLPPQERDPSRPSLLDATAYLHAFLINVFGAIDNLAQIWCIEANIHKQDGHPLGRMQIGLMQKHDIVRGSLSQEFRDYLTEADEWFAYIENYRHALAHRVPLYIPPRQLDDREAAEFLRLENEMVPVLGDREPLGALRVEQARLGIFNPVVMHSYAEGARPMRLHPQLLCDLSTVIEIAELLVGELNGLPPH